jgi:hypothetical protein
LEQPEILAGKAVVSVSTPKSLQTGNIIGIFTEFGGTRPVSNEKNARFMGASLKIPYSE